MSPSLQDAHSYLVALDGSDAAYAALGATCDLAKRTKASVGVLYVIEVPRSVELDADLPALVERGEEILAACSAEGLACRRDVVVDAQYDGKPVCTVTLPWVVEGHAVLFADDSAVAEERLRSLASALAMPVCVVRRAA